MQCTSQDAAWSWVCWIGTCRSTPPYILARTVAIAGLGGERGRDYDEGRKYSSGQDSATGYGSGYGGEGVWVYMR